LVVRAGHVLILMFDTIRKERDEIRFSLCKFKLPRLPRPAWDQYLMRKMIGDRLQRPAGVEDFASPGCLSEYELASVHPVVPIMARSARCKCRT
jgi:hypothetical protein